MRTVLHKSCTFRRNERFFRCKKFPIYLQNDPIENSLSQKGILLQFIL